MNDRGDQWPYSPTLYELQTSRQIDIIPFQLSLDYTYWTYQDIISSILPAVPSSTDVIEEDADVDVEMPTSFQIIGHVAHLNLRERYLPYRKMIGEILLDKNVAISTVINKIDDVGEESAFRTFRYEVLAGKDDLSVTVREQECWFAFDYAKVYWNSRLSTEHERLVEKFKDGEAVCDVMAGIGPFAIPAGKKRCFVWANDLNPDSYSSLVKNIERNKVAGFVRGFNTDGHGFIKSAARELLSMDYEAEVEEKVHKEKKENGVKKGGRTRPIKRKVKQPRYFSHYVMNLPASATDFLPDFIGLFSGLKKDEMPEGFKLPLIHCHCFDTKSDDNLEQTDRICALVSEKIGFEIKPTTPETEVWDVRDVAPKKRMFCVTFRLPEEVAFRS